MALAAGFREAAAAAGVVDEAMSALTSELGRADPASSAGTVADCDFFFSS